MIAALQAGANVPESIWTTMQLAAIALETGGALLIVAIFGVASRVSLRRDYFTTWTIAWRSLVIGIASIGTCYYLVNASRFGGIPKSDFLIHLLNWLYVCGKLVYWAFIWRGALEYARPGRVAGQRWHLAAAMVVLGTIAEFVSRDLNDLMVIQAPVATMACALGAMAMLRLPAARRTSGSATVGMVLAATAVLWVAYFVAFASAIGLTAWAAGPAQRLLLSYNSYADMLALVTLGFAMLMLFMEDARLRIAHIEARMGSLVMSAPEAIVTLDAQHRVVTANRAAEQLFGAGPRLAPGAPAANLVVPAERERLAAAIAAFAVGDEAVRVVGDDGVMTGLCGLGDPFAAEITLTRLFDADVSAVSLVARDMTQRREREERRRQATTMEAVRQLAGGLAHDFNNLLTTIIGRSQIVARALPAASPVRDDMQQVEAAAGAAARLSHGLLALSRREPLDPERISIDDVVRACHSRMCNTPGVTVGCDAKFGSANAHAHLDRTRLERALTAIGQNAIEATPPGGTIVIETSRALLPQHAGATAEVTCIAIRDRGPGLSADARAHLFEPFFSTKGDGRGLGLATTWAFVHQSGGTIDVDSGPQGTTVRLLFPLAAERPEEREAVAPAKLAIVPGARRANRTVLVAEDEPSVRNSVKAFLERAGFAVVTAADGVEALAAFERSPDEFGLLLTDVMMPQMGGRELTTRLLELRPGLRVVFMSGFLRDPEVLRMVNDRRVRFVSKPFDVDTLLAVVRAELEQDGANVA